MRDDVSKTDIDQGYAWVILGCGCVCEFLMGMLYYSTGVVNSALLETLDEGMMKTSWVGSTMLGTLMLSGPLVSFLVQSCGCRLSTVIGGLLILVGLTWSSFSLDLTSLILSYGVCLGLGVGIIATADSVAVGHFFERRRPLAVGIQVSGAGFGMLIGAPLVRFLLDIYSLSGMFLLLGAIGFHACVAGMLMRPSVYERTSKPCHKAKREPDSENSVDDAEKHKLKSSTVSYLKIFTNIGFMLYVMSYFLWSLGEAGFLLHLPSYVEGKGTSPQKSAMLFTAMGITSTLARILTGFAGSDDKIGTYLLHSGLLGCAGICILLVPMMSASYVLQVTVTALYGLYAGGPVTLLNPITVDLLGVRNLAHGYGLNNLFGGIGLLLGPPIAAALYEVSGNFDVSIEVEGGLIVIGSLVSLPIVVFKKRRTDIDNQTLELDIHIDKHAETPETIHPLLEGNNVVEEGD